MATTVTVKYPGVSVVPVSHRQPTPVRINTPAPSVIKVVGVNSTSEYTYYAQWLTVDGGDPFSVFTDNDVMDGGSVDDL